MSFLKNLFPRKKQEAAAEQPAPQAEQPAPAPAPVLSGGEVIRKTIDTMSQRLIASPDQQFVTAGMRLQELMREVDDASCAYEGFDEIIAGAIRQMEHLCQTCTAEQISGHISKIEAAIAARGNTEQNTDKFAPTMQTHYYSVMLVELQGRMNAMLQSIASKQRFIDNVKVLPMEEQLANQETVMAFTTSISSTQLALMAMRKQIAVCRGGLETARDQLAYDGPLPVLDISAVLGPIYQQGAQFQRMIEDMNRSANAFQVMHAGQVEEQMRAVALAAAAKKQQEQQIAQSQMLTDSIQAQIAQLTGQAVPAAPVQESAPVKQEAAPAMAEQAAEETLPPMPDVFSDSFDAMTM